MRNLEIKNNDCHAALAMTEKRWGFPRRTLRALLGMTENTQSVRSLLEESGADAPQSGRSMIEMLGVLAIIGVLSVGGIAGYSKAMTKYRINKTIEQITIIAGNVRAFFAPQRSYEGLGYCSEADNAPDSQKANCKLIKKAKLMPDEMWDDTAKKFNNVFGYEVFLNTAHKSTNTDKQAFYISYLMPTDYEICIELLSQDWGETGVKGITIMGSGGTKCITIPADIDNVTNKCATVIGSASTWQMLLYFDINSNCWRENGENGHYGNYCS